MKELTLREIQLSSLEILKTFADICEEKGFKYFLIYGTLLGAVRHKGFIPWDDDLDVLMPRPDYNKFIEYCKEHKEQLKPLELMHYSTNKKYIYPVARLSDSRYVADYFNSKDYGLGTFIDIYPFDGCGNDQNDIKKTHKKMERLRYITYCAGLKSFEKSARGGVFFTAAKLLTFCFAQLIGPNRLSEILDKRAQKIDFYQASYVVCAAWEDCQRYAFNKAILENTMYMDFENEKFRVPRDYDVLLAKWYGNYMELPPENERVGHHYYKIYKK